jgi:hypothetical protein
LSNAFILDDFKTKNINKHHFINKTQTWPPQPHTTHTNVVRGVKLSAWRSHTTTHTQTNHIHQPLTQTNHRTRQMQQMIATPVHINANKSAIKIGQ